MIFGYYFESVIYGSYGRECYRNVILEAIETNNKLLIQCCIDIDKASICCDILGLLVNSKYYELMEVYFKKYTFKNYVIDMQTLMEENDLEAVKMYFKLLSNSPKENINKHYKKFIKECKATGKKVMLEYFLLVSCSII